VVDRIIDHLKLGFVADRPQPCSPHGFHEGRLRVFLSRSPCPAAASACTQGDEFAAP
jgi:hypothetical protein